jgi:hypothetical protein
VTASGWQREHEQEGQPEDAHLEPQRVLDRGGEDLWHIRAGPDGEPVDDAGEERALAAVGVAQSPAGDDLGIGLIGSPPWRTTLREVIISYNYCLVFLNTWDPNYAGRKRRRR